MIKKGYKFKSGYEVQFVLKKGDYARNYRVYDADRKLKVLKLIDYRKLTAHQLDENTEVLESSILSAIDHDNIIKYEESGTEIIESVKYFYIVTDFVSGITLEKYKISLQINKYEATDIAKDILTGLSYLHTLDDPVIHNEINLTNILFDLSNDTKKAVIIDFGHARRLSGSYSSLTKDDFNPFFIAPEIQKNLFSQQSDIFSVGAILYSLLDDLPPWFTSISSYKAGNKETASIVARQRKKPLKRPERADDHLFEVLQKALSLDPMNRFKSSDEFLHALENKDSSFLQLNLDAANNTLQKTPNLTPKEGDGFDAVVGLNNLKNTIQEDIIDILNDPEGAKEYGLSLPNGMLLWGPPGCGKTYFAERLSEEVGYNFISVKPSDLGSIYVHGGQGKIKELFDSARENAPTIIFFDELDALVPNRSGGMNQSISGEVNEFLTQMSNCSEHGVFIIGATNRPDMIDSAVKRAGRIDKKFYIPRPDLQIRSSLFKLYLTKRPLDVGVNFEEFGNRTEYYVSSDIAFICNEAAKAARRAKSKITSKIVLDTISTISPSVDKNELESYEALHNQISNSDENEHNPRRKIGFKRY